MNRLSYGQLKQKTEGWFHRFIRLRDCLMSTNTIERGRCFTCRQLFPFLILQAGHFMTRAGAPMHQFDERNVHAQCWDCNINKGGNISEYKKQMRIAYGVGITEFLQTSKIEDPLSRLDLEAIRARYKKYCKIIEKSPSIETIERLAERQACVKAF